MAILKTVLAITLVTMSVLGCGETGQSPSPTPLKVDQSPGRSPSTVQWVVSDDGLLSLRLSMVSQAVPTAEPIQVVAQLRNAGSSPITVLRPFGDWYVAEAIGMKIWDEERRIQYTGPNATYVIGADAFAVLDPGEIVEDRLDLSIDSFAGIRRREIYTVRYDYSYDGQWDKAGAAGNSGIRDAWRGTISSREVQVVRE